LLALAQAKGGGTPEIEILDLRTGKRLSVLKGEVFSGFLFRGALAFTSDGQRLAVGRPDGSIRLWDPRTSIELLTLRGHQSPVYQLTFTPDGNGLVSVAADDSARLWNATPLPDRR
jgi:WD40 repeat protein